jgi:predicted enzyme related to lactoylglutathione lyase
MTTHTTPRAHGAFTWIDLVTPDLEAAKKFYQQLFGWEYLDTGEDFGHYHFALSQGRNAAGLNQLQPDSQTPSLWTLYFASDDAAADVARVKALGGQVYLEPMTVGDSGIMAVCADSTGAAFGLWQAINHIGASVEGEHGGIAWSEVAARDAAAACDFYGKLFGLTAHKMEGQEYFIMQRGEEMLFGVMQMDEQWGDLPPHWMGYFAIDNTDAAVERVISGGGKVIVPAFDTPYGRIAVIADPYGAVFSIVQLPAQG